MIVIDVSVLASALLDDGSAGERARAVLTGDTDWAAPGHLPLEVVSVIRGLLRGRKISAQRAGDAASALADLAISLTDCQRLVARVWHLRDNLTAYDAAYVALAEALSVALVTTDRRLTEAAGSICQTIVP